MSLVAVLRRRLLRFSLFSKILIANCTIVTLGATLGIYLTTQHVKASPHETHYEMMLFFGLGGLSLSLVFNVLVLRTALLPLARLERTARRVLGGDLDARATLGALGDPDTDRLATTFNAMLDRLSARAQEIQAYSTRLQELSDRVLIAQEEERRRIARELHDDTGQVLSTLLVHLRIFRDLAGQPNADLETLRNQANSLTEMAREALDGIRVLALELRPSMLDDLGLEAALRAYVEDWRARSGIRATFDAELPPERALSNTAEIAVYRMVQEALTNVARHAQATRASVSVTAEGGQLIVEVRDNGRGMDASPVPSATSSGDVGTGLTVGVGAGIGLFGMQERIGLAGGALQIDSAPGQGTTVRAILPLQPPSPVPAERLNGKSKHSPLPPGIGVSQ